VHENTGGKQAVFDLPSAGVGASAFCEEFDFTARAKADDAKKAAKSKFDQLFGG
jgi:hypothetical protein